MTTTAQPLTPRRRKKPSVRGPRIRELTQAQVKRVLSRNHVGRVAFILKNQIELHPVHFVYLDGAIYGRTSFGAKYVAWMSKPYVAFEVDEVNGPFDWRSVIIRGTVYMLTARGSPTERADFRRAVAGIRKLLPAAFTSRDPTPYRNVIFRVEPHEITGRAASASAD